MNQTTSGWGDSAYCMLLIEAAMTNPAGESNRVVQAFPRLQQGVDQIAIADGGPSADHEIQPPTDDGDPLGPDALLGRRGEHRDHSAGESARSLPDVQRGFAEEVRHRSARQRGEGGIEPADRLSTGFIYLGGDTCCVSGKW